MVNTHKVGLAVGAFAGFWHVIWSILVALKLAQPLSDFILGLHFMDAPHTFQDFRLSIAIILVLVASLVGYIAGFVFSTIWNLVHKS